MAVVLVHQGPSLTQERYDQVVHRLTGGKSRLQSPSDWPAEGLLVHTAGQSPEGFRVVDVWESEEACQRFGEVLEPILKEIGVTDPPAIYSAHALSRPDPARATWLSAGWFGSLTAVPIG